MNLEYKYCIFAVRVSKTKTLNWTVQNFCLYVYKGDPKCIANSGDLRKDISLLFEYLIIRTYKHPRVIYHVNVLRMSFDVLMPPGTCTTHGYQQLPISSQE